MLLLFLFSSFHSSRLFIDIEICFVEKDSQLFNLPDSQAWCVSQHPVPCVTPHLCRTWKLFIVSLYRNYMKICFYFINSIVNDAFSLRVLMKVCILAPALKWMPLCIVCVCIFHLRRVLIIPYICMRTRRRFSTNRINYIRQQHHNKLYDYANLHSVRTLFRLYSR